jgi:hypothetical protein
VSPAPESLPVVSDREARVRKLEKCLSEVDGDLKSIRSNFALGKWAVGLMLVSVLGLGGYVVRTTIETAGSIEAMEASQLEASGRASTRAQDARTIRVKLGEISSDVRNLRESQRRGERDLNKRLDRIEDRVNSRRR